MGLLKIVAIISVSIIHTIALIYSLLTKQSFHKPPIFLTLSTTIFTILLLQLSHDQLQTIAYYPITNLTFLVTFCICCILHKESTIKKWWSLIQILAISFYILHQQFKIRQILYGLFQHHDGGIYGVGLMAVGVIGEGVLFLGVGVVMRVAVDGEDKVRFYRQSSEQIQPIMFIQLDQYIQNSSPKQLMPGLAKSLQWIVQISKTLLICIAPIMDILCILYQVTTDNKISFYDGHTHKHIYTNTSTNKRTNVSIYFHDRNNISIIGLFFIWVRVISAAIVFHFAFLIWEHTFKQFEQFGKQKIKSMFWVGVMGFGVGLARMACQWM